MRILLVAAALTAPVAPAAARVVTFDFTGTVTETYGPAPSPVGASIRGQLSYALVPMRGDGGYQGIVRDLVADGFRVTTPTSSYISVLNDIASACCVQDSISVDVEGGGPNGGFENIYLFLANGVPRIGYNETRAPLFTSTRLPAGPIDFGLVNYTQLFFQRVSPSYLPLFQQRMEITSFVASPASAVPEPTQWAMMILGLGFVGAAMRRRRVAAGVRPEGL